MSTENKNFVERIADSSFMHKLEEVSMNLSGPKLFSAISGGMGGTMGLLMTGAVFQIICVIGSTFFGWDTTGTLYNFFYTPYRWTMGILSFFMAYCISASYSKQLGVNQMMSGFTSMACYFIVCCPLTEIEGNFYINIANMGTTNLFVALIIGLVCARIMKFAEDKNLRIKLPDSVPEGVGNSFKAIIPMGMCIIFWYVLSYVIMNATGTTLSNIIIGILSVPLKVLISTPGMFVIMFVAQLCWFFGIHGTSVVFAVILMPYIQAYSTNAALAASGQPLIYNPVFLYGAMAVWGGATAANQYEGGWNEGGRGMSSSDVTTGATVSTPRFVTYIDKEGNPKTVPMYAENLQPGEKYAVLDGYYYPNHIATDFYHRYKEDIALFHELGLKMFRMSISWSRIYPNGNEDTPNQEGLNFYHAIFDELHKYSIEPLVTISHYDDPLNIKANLGGWQNRNTIQLFEKYCHTIFEEYKNDVKYWLTFNEINTTIMIPTLFPDYPKAKASALFDELHNKFVASAKVVKHAHEHYPSFKMGCMIAGVVTYPLTCDPKDLLCAQHKMQDSFYYAGDVMIRGAYSNTAKRLWKQYDVQYEKYAQDEEILKEGHVDFMSYSYYATHCETTHTDSKKNTGGNFSLGYKNPYLKYSEWGWAMDPDGLRYSLNEFYGRYQVPIMVVENGLGANDVLEEDGSVHDPYRIEYFKGHVEAMDKAINEDGVDLIAYTPWGIIDLVSASTGEMRKRYGIIYVDMDDEGKGTLNRYKKDSFEWYKTCIQSDGKII